MNKFNPVTENDLDDLLEAQRINKKINSSPKNQIRLKLMNRLHNKYLPMSFQKGE